MSRHIPESDWRQFKEIHSILSERFCRQTLEEIANVIASSKGSAHDRYLKVFRLIQRRDKELDRAFNDFRRSTALTQLGVMRLMRLLTDEELRQFSPQTQKFIEDWESVMRA